ncbi:MAG: hypothetical protein JWP63_2438 [Candidatus Solibacter sp.]|nr:hypothetical protein [Candidatus Solibacter sp.]
MKKPILLMMLAGMCAAQTTVNGGRDYKGTLSVSGPVSAVDFSGGGTTAPAKTGALAARPTACTRGHIYFATDATAGQNLFFCTTTGTPGTWSQMSGGSGGGTSTATGSGAPSGSCAAGAMYIDTTNQELWFCGAANSWKKATADLSNVPTLTGGNTWTGYNNQQNAQWRPPESTVGSLPAAAANTGKVFMVTDAASAGNCTTGGGTVRELCRAAASAYECVGGCGTGGTGGGGTGGVGGPPYITNLIAGPDTTKTIAGTTHGFATSGLLVAVYDNATPRNAISAGWTVNPSTYDVVITFAAAQSNYYVVINGGSGPQGPAGPTGGGSTGTVNSGTVGQIAAYTGAGTIVGGIGPGTTAQVLHGNPSGQPSYGQVATADIAANAVGTGQLAVVNTRRTCMIVVGADNGTALAAADIAPQGRQCFVPAAAHVVEIGVTADAGTPAVVVARNHAGTLTDLSASLVTAGAGAPACANAAGTGAGIDGATTCSVQLTTTALAAGDWLETHSSVSAGTSKRMSIAITYTVD